MYSLLILARKLLFLWFIRLFSSFRSELVPTNEFQVARFYLILFDGSVNRILLALFFDRIEKSLLINLKK